MKNDKVISKFLTSIKELVKTRNIDNINEELILKEIEIAKYLLNNGIDVVKKFEKRVLMELEGEDSKYNIYLYSFLVRYLDRTEYLNNFIKYIIKDKKITVANKYFLFDQIKNKIFSMKIKSNNETTKLMWDLYSEVYLYFEKRFHNYNKISKSERREDLVVIMTSQFLGVNHAPTKITLERAYLLSKNLNKKVVIINTAEVMNSAGAIPVVDCIKANKVKGYEGISSIKYKDVEIGMYQSSVKMPNLSEYKKILDYLSANKPYMVISVGGGFVGGDLANLIVPTITLSLSSELAISMSDFKVICKKPTELEYKILEDKGKSKNSVIISIPSYSLTGQKNKLSRIELGIEKEKVVITVIGNRLDYEVDEELLETLDFMVKENGYVIFIGEFNEIHNKVKKYRNLKNSYSYMGYQEDLLSVIEISDINVNPKRKGGATSAVYSLYKGKPVLTISYGDVASVVGEVFCVENFREMKMIYNRLIKDEMFYKEMSIKALERSEKILRGETNFIDVYNSINESELFI